MRMTGRSLRLMALDDNDLGQLDWSKLAGVPLEELYLSANPQLSAYGAEVSQCSWPSLRVLDMSRCFSAMPILTRLALRNNPLSKVEKLVCQWHAPTRKFLDLRWVDNLPERTGRQRGILNRAYAGTKKFLASKLKRKESKQSQSSRNN